MPLPASGPDAQGGWQKVTATFKRLGPAGPLALIAASMPALVGFTVLGFLPVIGGWLQSRAAQGAGLYVTVYAVLGSLGFLPTYAHSALGGYAFGFGRGLALAMGSYASAALIAYVVNRRAAGRRVLDILAEHPKWEAVYQALLGCGLGRTLLIVTLVRLPPNSPFALTNLVLASTRVHPLAYLVGTVAGLTPRSAAVVFVASRFGLDATGPKWLWPVWIAVTIGVLGTIGYLANQAVARVTGGQPAADRSVKGVVG
ncbi:MAG: TVP38/TMEM64 family protein [Phycisphaerae bacterium]